VTDWGEVASQLTYWYGLGYREIAEMPSGVIRAYLERLPARLAEWKMAMAEAVSLPYMREGQQRQIIAAWRRAATGGRPVPARPASDEVLRMMGIRVVKVSSEKQE
jgi:hypothetical protein